MSRLTLALLCLAAWPVAAQIGPLETSAGSDLTRASTRTPGPVRVMRGARISTHSSPANSEAGSSVSALHTNESSWVP